MPINQKVAALPVATPSMVAPAFSPAPYIQALGQAGGEIYKAKQESKLEESFAETTHIVTEIGELQEEMLEKGSTPEHLKGAMQQLSYAKTVDQTVPGFENASPELLNKLNRLKSVASAKFNAIAQGVAQGATSQEAAALSLEATVKTLVNETPGFGPEIRELARNLAGFDPSNYAMRKMLNLDRGTQKPQTALEKRMEEVGVIVDGMARIGRNINPNIVAGNLALKDFNEAENAALVAQVKTNGIGFQQGVQEKLVRRGPNLSNLIADAAVLSAQGGVVHPEQYVAGVDRQIQADKNEILRLAAESGVVDQDEISKSLAMVDTMYAPAREAYKVADLGKIIDRNMAAVSAINAQEGYKVFPDLVKLTQYFPKNPNIVDTLINMMHNTADPAQFELLYKLSPGLKQLIESGSVTRLQASKGITDTTVRILNGENLSANDMQFVDTATALVVDDTNKNPARTEVREKFLESLSSNAPVKAASVLATSIPRYKATDKEVTLLKRQYDLYIGSHGTEGTPNLISQAAEDIPDYALETLGVDKAGNLTYDPRPAAIRSQGGFHPFGKGMPDSLKGLQMFVTAAKNGYDKDLGIDRKTFAKDLVNKIKLEADMAKEEKNKAMSGTVERK